MSAAELRDVPHFSDLAPGELAALAAALDVRDYPDGHVFIREGSRGDQIYVLFSGEIVVSRAHGDHRHELNLLGPSSLFGLIALVDEKPRSADCVARGPCRVGAWPKPVVTMLLNQRAPLARAFQLALATQLAQDFRKLDRRIREMAAH
jgi:CRP-like cAMP-binding protein